MANGIKKKKMSLGKLLKVKRLAKNLTQKDISNLLGYSSPQFVSNWERELARPPLEKMAKLLDCYEIDRGEFIELWVGEQRSLITQALNGKKNRTC